MSDMRSPEDMTLAYPAPDRTGFDSYAEDSVAPESEYKQRANGYVVGYNGHVPGARDKVGGMALGGVPGTPVSPAASPEKPQHKNFTTEAKDKQGASMKVKPKNFEGQGYTPGYTGFVPQDKYRFGSSPYSESEQLQPPANVKHHWG